MKNQNAYFIIWNSSKQNFKSIVEYIENHFAVKEKKEVQIKKYFDFICDIYDFNNQRDLGVYKANLMCNDYNYSVIVVEVELIHDYSVIKTTKKAIRKYYSSITEGYFHDNIIHATDTNQEYKHVKVVLKKLNNYL